MVLEGSQMINKLKIPSIVLICAVILLLNSGCGTMMNGTQHYLGIMSDPPGAKVTVDNKIIFDTPVTVVLDKRDNHRVIIELDGYLPYEMKISRKPDFFLAAVGIFPLFPSIVIDFITGGIYTLSPEQVKARLKKEDLSNFENGNLLLISFSGKADSTMKKIGTLTRTIH